MVERVLRTGLGCLISIFSWGGDGTVIVGVDNCIFAAGVESGIVCARHVKCKKQDTVISFF